MNDFDDEIIDLEDETDASEVDSTVSPRPHNNITRRIKNNDTTTAQKLRSLSGKNMSFPPIGGSSFNKTNNEEQSTEEGIKDSVKNVQTKVASKAVSKYTGGLVQGKAADVLAEKVVEKFNKKIKWFIIGASIALIIIMFVVLLVIGNIENQSGIGKDTVGYATGSINEDELIKQLKHYGYCKKDSECKKKSIYKFYNKLKEVYEEYSKECPSNLSINKPCEVSINTALIIETANYYQNYGQILDKEVNEESDDSGIDLKKIFDPIVNAFKKKQKSMALLSDVNDLALAQVEYVKETSRYMSEEEKEKDTKGVNKKNKYVNYYFQVSNSKFTSYLLFGNSSDHPNYSGKPVEVKSEVYHGPQNDAMSTSYSESSPSAAGDEIAKYALQFEGGNYVWGGTDLNTGVDCSGFTMKVFEHFGISLPHNSTAQLTAGGVLIGTDISKALPGDIIVYGKKNGIGHVAIYLGNNEIIHAADEKSGIKKGKNASYRPIAGIVRYWS